MHLPFHPAAGFGDLLPGHFVVPQNPIRDAGTPMVPSVQAASGNVPVRIPKMGDLLPGMFVVPQNPLMAAIMGADVTQPDKGAGKAVVASLHGLGCGGGCGGACGCGGYSPHFAGLGVAPNPSAIVNVPERAAARMLPRYDLKRFEGYAYGPQGLGDINSTLQSAETWLTAPSALSASIPNWMLWGGAAVAVWLLMPGGSEYRTQTAALRSQYRGYRRAARAAGSIG